MFFRLAKLVEPSAPEDHPIQVCIARRHFVAGVDLAVMNKMAYNCQMSFYQIIRPQTIDDLLHPG